MSHEPSQENSEAVKTMETEKVSTDVDAVTGVDAVAAPQQTETTTEATVDSREAGTPDISETQGADEETDEGTTEGTVEDTAITQDADGQAPSPKAQVSAQLKPIPKERIKRARRTKVMLIFLIIVLLAALGGLVYLGYTLLQTSQEHHTTVTVTPDTVIDSNLEDTSQSNANAIKTTTIPDLSGLFGLSVAESQEFLGSDYVLIKTDDASEDDNPDIKQMVVFSYQPRGSVGSSSALAAAPSIYLSLNAQGEVIEVYFISSLEVLGYPSATFVSFVSTQDMLYNALRAAGVTPSSDYVYNAPTPSEFTVYVNATTDVKKIRKEEVLFTGSTTNQNAPKIWQFKLIYDYGASGITQGSDIKPNQRTISILLR